MAACDRAPIVEPVRAADPARGLGDGANERLVLLPQPQSAVVIGLSALGKDRSRNACGNERKTDDQLHTTSCHGRRLTLRHKEHEDHKGHKETILVALRGLS